MVAKGVPEWLGLAKEAYAYVKQPTAYFSGFEVPGFLFKSLRSLLRPNACLLAARSSKEMKCTGMPKKVLATLFLHAAGNLTPVMSVRMSMRTGAIPI